MAGRSIEITIPRDHNRPVTVEVNGDVGSGCKALTEKIEQALGSTGDTTEKPEFHEIAKEADRLKQ